jgi:hypothetical protein
MEEDGKRKTFIKKMRILLVTHDTKGNCGL